VTNFVRSRNYMEILLIAAQSQFAGFSIALSRMFSAVYLFEVVPNRESLDANQTRISFYFRIVTTNRAVGMAHAYQ